MIHERGPKILEFTVPADGKGEPAGAGSKTAEPLGKRFAEARDSEGRILLKYRPSSKFTKPWMEKVTRHAGIHWMGKPPLDGALYLDLGFYETRSKDHYFHRKSGDVLRPDAPAYPCATETVDYDKMRRAISDSLTIAGVILDDRRVVGGEGFKMFADTPPYRACAVIRLGLMKAVTVEDLQLVSPPAPGQETLA